MEISQAAHDRKGRGAFFTPPEICRFIADWAIRSEDDMVFEPSCGEAAFILAAGERLKELGGSAARAAQLYGVDLHPESVEHARRAAKEAGVRTVLHVSDFFDFATRGRFDAVIGNPPYVRYQGFSGDARLKANAAALAQGVRLTNLASSWAAFVVHASAALEPTGRLGLVLPAELLSVNYAAPVRAFLMKRFARVRLVLFEERVFPGVIEEVVLLLAEGMGGTDHFEVVQVQDLAELAEVAPPSPTRWTPRFTDDKWVPALLPARSGEVYSELVGDPNRFVPLLQWGDPTLGMVTGNNRFFTLTAADAERAGLLDEELLPISPPGSRHLRGISFGAADWRRLRDQGKPVYLFMPDPKDLSAAAQRYIARGRRAKVHTAFKCRVRKPWWRTPLVDVPDLFFTYMNADAPRLVSNRARVRYLNSVHGLVVSRRDRALAMSALPIAMLNSLSLTGAELVGRSYGGGLLKLEPKEADLVPVPSRELLTSAASDLASLRKECASLLSDGGLEEVVRRVDRVLLGSHGGVSRASIDSLEDARGRLHARRVSRMGS